MSALVDEAAFLWLARESCRSPLGFEKRKFGVDQGGLRFVEKAVCTKHLFDVAKRRSVGPSNADENF